LGDLRGSGGGGGRGVGGGGRGVGGGGRGGGGGGGESVRRQLRCVFPRGMGGSQKLWVLPGQDRGQWLLLQLPKNTLPGTVMNLALQLKPESAARLGHGKLEAACSSAQSPKEMMRRGAPLREPRERAASAAPGVSVAGEDGRIWRCEEVPASAQNRAYRLWHLSEA